MSNIRALKLILRILYKILVTLINMLAYICSFFTQKSKARSEAKRKQTINSSLRAQVWRKRNPTHLDGPCYSCGVTISRDNFVCGHIIAEALGGPTNLDNLEPICQCCNSSMRVKNLNEFKKQFIRQRVDSKGYVIVT